MYQTYTIDNTTGQRGKFGSWFKKNWKKIASTVATVVGGPLIGAVVSLALSQIQRSVGVVDTLQFSPVVEKHLDAWAISSFNQYLSRKISIFKTVTTKEDLVNVKTLRLINRILLEMAIIQRFYFKSETFNSAIPSVVNAKSIVMTDAINEFVAIYEGALARVGASVPKNTVLKDVTPVLDSPDPVNMSIVERKINAIHYGTPVVAPGDHPSGGRPDPSSSSTDQEVFMDDKTDPIVLPPLFDNNLPINTTVTSTPIVEDTAVMQIKKNSGLKSVAIGAAALLGLFFIVGDKKKKPKSRKRKKSKK